MMLGWAFLLFLLNLAMLLSIVDLWRLWRDPAQVQHDRLAEFDWRERLSPQRVTDRERRRRAFVASTAYIPYRRGRAVISLALILLLMVLVILFRVVLV
ncbi:MAG: hypothetical protein GYB68_16385 [Chloroflexi bacterium]|nr:hypothetical protein [Chloroflexota bacterium]